MKYRQIKLDIDQKIELFNKEYFLEKVSFIEIVLNIKFSKITYYKSKHGNVHVSMWSMSDLREEEIIIIQLALGSDWRREIYNLGRINRDQKNWNILFEHKEVNL